jgi:hypothetical protein
MHYRIVDTKFHEKSSRGSRAHTRVRADGRRDMAKLIGTFPLLKQTRLKRTPLDSPHN